MAGRILIVDDLAINRIILKVKLASACHDSVQAADGTSALALARSEKPRLILLDMMLPDISGIEVCRQLRADPLTRDIPVVIITASSDRARRLEALEAGADEFLTKPLNEVILLARIRSLLRARETEGELRLRAATCHGLGEAAVEAPQGMPGRIGLIAGDAATAMNWRTLLAPLTPDRLEILTPAAALTDANDRPAPDLYLVACDLGKHGSGLRLVADLRSRASSRDAAISLVLPEAEPETAAMALDLGATDILTQPLEPQETALRLRLHIQRKRRADLLRRQVHDGMKLAVTDPLTGLHNRRYALAQLERIAGRAACMGHAYAVMALDLDRFKSINDRFGHPAGDLVLERVAGRLRDCLRPGDLVARIGGEEFLVALPEIRLGAAHRIAERLCAAVADLAIDLSEGNLSTDRLPGGGTPVRVTVSVGLAMGGPATSAQDTLHHADAALMAAKGEGRNQVTVWARAA